MIQRQIIRVQQKTISDYAVVTSCEVLRSFALSRSSPSPASILCNRTSFFSSLSNLRHYLFYLFFKTRGASPHHSLPLLLQPRPLFRKKAVMMMVVVVVNGTPRADPGPEQSQTTTHCLRTFHAALFIQPLPFLLRGASFSRATRPNMARLGPQYGTQ